MCIAVLSIILMRILVMTILIVIAWVAVIAMLAVIDMVVVLTEGGVLIGTILLSIQWFHFILT